MKLAIEQSAEVINLLNQIVELEMSGVVRYTHYSLMIRGHARIPIVKWMREQANESLDHALKAGELVTHFEEHPSLAIASLDESHKHNIDEILKESLAHERKSLGLYHDLLTLVKDKSVLIEEYARSLIVEEETHIGEVEKMLKN